MLESYAIVRAPTSTWARLLVRTTRDYEALVGQRVEVSVEGKVFEGSVWKAKADEETGYTALTLAIVGVPPV